MTDYRTEETPSGTAYYGADPTFRTYAPTVVQDEHGCTVETQLCETLEGGRWEPWSIVLRDCAVAARLRAVTARAGRG